jgi:type III secretion protein T
MNNLLLSAPEDNISLQEISDFLIALALTQPRIQAVFLTLPILSRKQIPGMLRITIAVVFGVIAAPPLINAQGAGELQAVPLMMLILKESFIGFVIGYLVALVFWAFEALGFLIDNQRGASVASSLNPLTGNDTSPLGLLFNQAFIVFFFISGGFLLLLGLIYDSFMIWNVYSWTPTFRADTIPFFMKQLDRLASIGLLLAAPVMIAMFLSEVGLALVSRFVPQLQVFFLAMPIKSAIAVLILLLYMTTLFEYGLQYVDDLKDILPLLDSQWRVDNPVGGTP